MTTLSAGAAAGLLVALMVMSTSDSHGAEATEAKAANDLTKVSAFAAQAAPGKLAGNASVKPNSDKIRT